MVDAILLRAREQADRSEPFVRAAALMRIARVETAVNSGRARNTFGQGLSEAQRLPGRNGEYLLEQAQLLAAAVAPDILRQFPPIAHHMPQHFLSDRLGMIMLEHRHMGAAYEFVMEQHDPAAFPFGVVGMLMTRLPDDARRLAVFRRATEAWRANKDDRYIWLFQPQWQLLPADEAREVLREIVTTVLEKPECPVEATYDQEETIRITSLREDTLFRILHVLRHLEPSLAESLVAGHSQLAAAARRFPYGMESLMQEAEERRKAAPEDAPKGFFMMGNSDDFPYMESLMQAGEDGDFSTPMQYALGKYRRDANAESPNEVSKEFWPSTCEFRAILHAAGKGLGAGGEVLLERIPDPDLRLFALIEFAAALAGLPELPGVQREFRPRRAAG